MPVKMKSPGAIIPLAAALFLALAFSCEKASYNVAERAITVDVPNSIFNPPAATDGTAGPGVNFVNVTVTTRSGGVETPFTATLSNVDAGAEPGYSRLSLTVSGQLVSVKGQCALTSTVVVEAVADGAEDEDVARYSGYTGFPNLSAFKVDWAPSDVPSGYLRILPCPRPSADLVWDSGVPAPGSPALTDIGDLLAYGQVAIRLDADEYIADESLAYDLYYAIADENPSKYTLAEFGNTYLAYPWTAQWSYAEATGAAAKRIGAASYTMARFGNASYVAGRIDNLGHRAVLVDFNTVSGATVGHWALVCAVMTRAGVSVASDVFCIPIR